jgi:predicted transcriptional regulator
MLKSLLSPLVTSNTRAKLLLRFFSNPEASSYLRELAGEFSVSTNSVREELNRLSEANLLTSFKNGREVRYRASTSHPLFNELVSIAKKTLGIDHIVENIVQQLGEVKLALLVDDYAIGKDSGILDLVLVGNLDQARLAELVTRTEGLIQRKVRTLCLSQKEFEQLKGVLEQRPQLVLWSDGSSLTNLHEKEKNNHGSNTA